MPNNLVTKGKVTHQEFKHAYDWSYFSLTIDVDTSITKSKATNQKFMYDEDCFFIEIDNCDGVLIYN